MALLSVGGKYSREKNFLQLPENTIFMGEVCYPS